MEKNQRKRFVYGFFLIALFLISQNIYTQVYQSEMENLGPVEFINYEGPYVRFETIAQIRDIGYSLGVLIRNGQTTAGDARRYFVINSRSAPDGSKLDADIFGLGVDVAVDHIRNLRWIVQGYLMGAYEYSERDAALLAEFITIYNAVYRGDIRYFDSRFKTPVMQNLTQQRVGLSIRYDEWPGQTLIVIPLGPPAAGQLSAVEISPLIDSQVTEYLREQPDMGLEIRREMVDLMERQADEAAQEAAVQQETIRAEEQRLEADQQRAQEQQQQAQQEQERIAEQRQDPAADQGALDQQQQQAEEREREAVEQLQEIEERQQELEQQRETAEQVQQYAEDRAEEAQEARRGIAEDMQARIDQEVVSPAVAAEGILGSSIFSQNAPLGRIVKIDPASGNELRRSVINTINVRTITQIDNRLFAIAGEARGDGAVRLIEINTDTLEMTRQGDDDMSPNSLIWVNGNEFYAIASNGENFYLARFNLELARQARSSIAVHPFASVTISGDYIATQRADGSATLLNARDLTERR